MGLFEKLKVLRKRLASEQNVPPFIVFSDNVLYEMSAQRPSSLEGMLNVSGIGSVKLNVYGQSFLDAIEEHCRCSSVPMDVDWKKNLVGTAMGKPRTVRLGAGGTKAITYPLLREGRSLEEIAEKADIAVGTVVTHLMDLMQDEAISSIDCWLPVELQQRIIAAADSAGREKLKPIFEHLEQSVPYEHIRLTLFFEKQQSR